MCFASLLGVAVMLATAAFSIAGVKQTGGYWQLLPLGFGFLMGVGFFLIGVITLCVGRIRLTMDRSEGTGAYEVRSPIIDVGKPCHFNLDKIADVTLERFQEKRPSGSGGGSFPAKVCRSRLRLRSPRRVIILDETSNGREERVKAVAHAVADWLKLEIKMID